MNKSMIAYILGWIMKLEGLFMLIPVLVALIYREHNGVWFAIMAVCALVFGAVVTHKKPESNVFYMREGCIATAMSWFIMSVIGCLPFFLSGEIPSFTDALFETVSGFTTTGSTILKVCLIVCCSGVVLPTGSEVWEYLYFYLRLFR